MSVRIGVDSKTSRVGGDGKTRAEGMILGGGVQKHAPLRRLTFGSLKMHFCIQVTDVDLELSPIKLKIDGNLWPYLWTKKPENKATDK